MACSNVTGTDIDCHRMKIEDRAGKWCLKIFIFILTIHILYISYNFGTNSVIYLTLFRVMSPKKGGDFPLLPYYDTNCLNLSIPITIFDYVVLSWSSHQKAMIEHL